MSAGRIGGIAVRHAVGRTPTLMFLPGFGSDMTGTKAEHLAGWCAATGRSFLRFDYSGHGASDGAFIEGTISRWRDDALRVIDAVDGPMVLLGSSMGGWIALLVALARPWRVAAIACIAPAPDFTEALIWEAMTPAEQASLMTRGVFARPSDYGEPLRITRALIEDGRHHLLLGGAIPIAVPVRILHGQQDADVPWERSLTLLDRLQSADVRLTLIKDAGHRLSRPSDLAALEGMLDGLFATLENSGEALTIAGITPGAG